MNTPTTHPTAPDFRTSAPQTVNFPVHGPQIVKFIGTCPVSATRLYTLPGASHLEHQPLTFVASEYGMSGPDFYASWLACNNDKETYKKALALAKKGWQPAPTAPTSIHEIKERNAAAGGYFFSPKTVKAFGSKNRPEVFNGPGGTYFVTSQKNYDGSAREYRVHHFNNETASIRLAYNDGRQYGDIARATARQALKDAKELAEHGEAKPIELTEEQRALMLLIGRTYLYQRPEADRHAEQLTEALKGSPYGLRWQYRSISGERCEIYELASPRNYFLV